MKTNSHARKASIGGSSADNFFCAAAGGEAVDGTHQIYGIDVPAEIAARNGVAGERMGSFFHHLRGLLKHARRAAGHCV